MAITSRFNFQRGCGGTKGSPSPPGKGDRQALPKLNSPKQSRDPSRKDTDCLRNAGVQAVNDLLQLFLHAWSLEQVLLPKTAQGWSNSPSLQRLRHMVTHSEWGTLGHPASAPSTGKKPCPVRQRVPTGADLQVLVRNQVTRSSIVAEALSLTLHLTWWRACLNRWSTKSQISFGTCSGTSLVSSLSREPICRMDFSWEESTRGFRETLVPSASGP